MFRVADFAKSSVPTENVYDEDSEEYERSPSPVPIVPHTQATGRYLKFPADAYEDYDDMKGPGLIKTAELLKNESGIFPLVDSSGSSDPLVLPVIPVVDTKHKVSLGSIVSGYLSSQHALCRSPMTTIPKFDLLQPHKCPGQKSSRAAALNFTVRHSKKDLIHPCGGPDGSQLDRKLASKLVYSRFKPVKSLVDLNLDVEFFASCAFSGDDKFLYAGTGDGSVKMFNLQSSEESIHQLHKKDCCVEHILSSKDSKLLITE